MKKIIILITVFIVIAGAFLLFNNSGTKIDAIIYKSSTCGCCSKYIPYLKSKGFDIETKIMQDMSTIKTQYQIPKNMESCHTLVIGDYFVEGHVPIEAINKILEEKPDIDGISLPSMPAGSPGMPGSKEGVWTIYSLKDNKLSTFMEI